MPVERSSSTTAAVTPTLFTPEQLCDVSELSQADLKQFLELGLIEPFKIARSKREGLKAKYEFKELVLAMATQSLSEAGISLNLICPLILATRQITQNRFFDDLKLGFWPLHQPHRQAQPYQFDLKLMHFATFVVVGCVFPVDIENPNSIKRFDVLLARPGKKHKFIDISELTESERSALGDGSVGPEPIFTLVVNLTMIHLYIKDKLNPHHQKSPNLN